MTSKCRTVGIRAKHAAILGAAAATASAVSVTTVAPSLPLAQPVVRPISGAGVALSTFTSPFPPPGTLPDLTAGAAGTAYNLAQNTIDTVLPQILNSFNLGAFGNASGSGIGVLNQVPASLLGPVFDSLSLPFTPLLSAALGPVLTGALVPLLQGLSIMDSGGNVTLGGLLGLLGINPNNLVDPSGLSVPGVKIVTAGPAFTLLKMLGVDLGWTPGTASAVANAINTTQYLDIGAGGLLNTVLGTASVVPTLTPLVTALQLAINTVAGPVLNALDVVDVRVPIALGFGLGAFSTGQAYTQVLAGLQNQPGGVNHQGASPVLGSLTILPEILLNNPGRANGGLLARFYPFGDLLGINTVTPDVSAAHSGGTPLLTTGLAIGGANLLPIKVDATVEYQPFSDLAAWPNPFTLANNVVAGTLPTYLLRGISTNTLTTELASQLTGLTSSALAGNPLAANIYVTIPTATLPLLEPLYLTGDVLNVVSAGTLGAIPYRLANALAPALTSLVNLGYTDVVRNPDGTYSRTLDQAGVATPFMSFPNINWQQVPSDIVNSLVTGFQKQFGPNPTAAPPSVIQEVLSLLTGGQLGSPVAALPAAAQGVISNTIGILTGASTNKPTPLPTTSPTAASTVPSTNPALMPVSLRATPAAAANPTDKTSAATAPINTKIEVPSAVTASTTTTDGDTKIVTHPKASTDAINGTDPTSGRHTAAGSMSTPDSGAKPKHAATEDGGGTTDPATASNIAAARGTSSNATAGNGSPLSGVRGVKAPSDSPTASSNTGSKVKDSKGRGATPTSDGGSHTSEGGAPHGHAA